MQKKQSCLFRYRTDAWFCGIYCFLFLNRFFFIKYMVAFTVIPLLLCKKNWEMIILALEDIFQYLQSKFVWSTTRCLTLDATHLLFDLLLETLDGSERRMMVMGPLVMLQTTLHKSWLCLGWVCQGMSQQEGSSAFWGAVGCFLLCNLLQFTGRKHLC